MGGPIFILGVFWADPRFMGAELYGASLRSLAPSIVEMIHDKGRRIVAWDEVVSEEIFHFILDVGVEFRGPRTGTD